MKTEHSVLLLRTNQQRSGKEIFCYKIILLMDTILYVNIRTFAAQNFTAILANLCKLTS
jgi:hypothetical protein